jgi:hypothetical protein
MKNVESIRNFSQKPERGEIKEAGDQFGLLYNNIVDQQAEYHGDC